MKKQFKPFKEDAEECWFLLIMSFVSFCVLAVLNIYIGYEAVKYFVGDGWSFLGGLIILMSYIVTIPTFILSALSVRMIRYDNNKKYTFPLLLGIIGIIIGLILNNATILWIYIIVFSILLIASCIVCKIKKHENFC